MGGGLPRYRMQAVNDFKRRHRHHFTRRSVLPSFRLPISARSQAISPKRSLDGMTR